MSTATAPPCIRRRIVPALEVWRCPFCHDEQPAGSFHELGGGWYRCGSCWGTQHREAFRRDSSAALEAQ